MSRIIETNTKSILKQSNQVKDIFKNSTSENFDSFLNIVNIGTSGSKDEGKNLSNQEKNRNDKSNFEVKKNKEVKIDRDEKKSPSENRSKDDQNKTTSKIKEPNNKKEQTVVKQNKTKELDDESQKTQDAKNKNILEKQLLEEKKNLTLKNESLEMIEEKKRIGNEQELNKDNLNFNLNLDIDIDEDLDIALQLKLNADNIESRNLKIQQQGKNISDQSCENNTNGNLAKNLTNNVNEIDDKDLIDIDSDLALNFDLTKAKNDINHTNDIKRNSDKKLDSQIENNQSNDKSTSQASNQLDRNRKLAHDIIQNQTLEINSNQNKNEIGIKGKNEDEDKNDNEDKSKYENKHENFLDKNSNIKTKDKILKNATQDGLKKKSRSEIEIENNFTKSTKDSYKTISESITETNHFTEHVTKIEKMDISKIEQHIDSKDNLNQLSAKIYSATSLSLSNGSKVVIVKLSPSNLGDLRIVAKFDLDDSAVKIEIEASNLKTYDMLKNNINDIASIISKSNQSNKNSTTGDNSLNNRLINIDESRANKEENSGANQEQREQYSNQENQNNNKKNQQDQESKQVETAGQFVLSFDDESGKERVIIVEHKESNIDQTPAKTEVNQRGHMNNKNNVVRMIWTPIVDRFI